MGTLLGSLFSGNPTFWVVYDLYFRTPPYCASLEPEVFMVIPCSGTKRCTDDRVLQPALTTASLGPEEFPSSHPTKEHLAAEEHVR